MLFSGALRRALPLSLRSLSSPPSLGGLGNLGRSSFGIGMESPLALMGGSLRGKKCLKTNKSAAKRFIVRGNGRIKRGKEGKSHNTGYKGRKRVNRLAQSAPITEKSIEERMRRIIRA